MYWNKNMIDDGLMRGLKKNMQGAISGSQGTLRGLRGGGVIKLLNLTRFANLKPDFILFLFFC